MIIAGINENITKHIEVDSNGILYTYSAPYASKIVEHDANTTFVAIAVAGSSEASAVWQCRKILVSGTTTTTISWADGNTKFDNVATDLSALSYS